MTTQSPRYFKPWQSMLWRVALCTWVGLLVGVLSGCTLVGTAYQTSPRLMVFEMNRHFDLTASQYDAVSTQSERLYQWHRKQELPLLNQQLKQLANSVEQGYTTAQVNEVLDWLVSASTRMTSKATPAFTDLLRTSNPNNKAALKQKYAQDNARFMTDWMQLSVPQQQQKRFDQFVTWAQRIYGDLTDEQLTKLRAYSDTHVSRMDWVYEMRVYRQQLLLNLLEDTAATSISPAMIETRLNAYFNRFTHAPNPAHQQYLDHSRQQFAGLIVLLSNIVNREQRIHAKRALLKLVQTFNSIHEAP